MLREGHAPERNEARSALRMLRRTMPRRVAPQAHAQPCVDAPCEQVILTNLHRDAVRRVLGVDLASVLDQLEPFIPGRNASQLADDLLVCMLELAEQAPGNRVVVSLDPLNLDLSTKPGDSMHPPAAVHLPAADAMAYFVASPATVS